MKKQISVFIEEELIQKLDAIAQKNRRSRTNMLEVLIVEYVEKENNESEA